MMTKEQYIGLITIVRKEIVRFTRIWTQTLIPPVITQSLYCAIFGQFIGSRLGEIHGVSYMAFIIPGLVMMATINNSFSNVVSSFYGAKFQRNIEEMLVSPLPPAIIISGFVIGGVLRGVAVGVIVYVVTLLFHMPHMQHPFIVALFMILTAVLFSLAGFCNAMFAKSFDDVALFPTFVLTPLTYLGGVFYSVEHLPVWGQVLSKLNPILYTVNGFRYGFYGITDVNIWISFSILFAFIVVFTLVNVHLMRKGFGLKS